MTASDPTPPQRSSRASIRRYIPVTILGPLVGASLGIDGGPIFQILAVENLGLSAAAIGLAFGLGVVSLPIQLYASRLPIERARRNVQIYLVLAALQAWVLAVLVGIGATGGLATVALGITVIAEISLSVFFATAWQPLLASGVDTYGRQRLNSTWPALARGVLAGAVVLFAALGSTGRSAFLAVAGALSIATAIGLNAIAAPRPAPPPAATMAASRRSATALAPATRIALVVFAAVNLGAIPLWLVYLDEVLWPTANLGAIAAVQTVASMAALLAWRSTDGDVTRRALVASIATLVAAVGIALLDGPADSRARQAVVVAATALVAVGTTTVRIAMLEAAHRVVRPANTVRAFTLIDVVASTSLQVGLLLSGLLITASTGAATGLADPYRGFVVITSAATIPAILWFRRRSSEDDGRLA
jgi:hypothetical protein